MVDGLVLMVCLGLQFSMQITVSEQKIESGSPIGRQLDRYEKKNRWPRSVIHSKYM